MIMMIGSVGKFLTMETSRCGVASLLYEPMSEALQPPTELYAVLAELPRLS